MLTFLELDKSRGCSSSGCCRNNWVVYLCYYIITMIQPKISVVTVCDNVVNDIEKTILSVINQTYSNVEYLIIDGGSTDGTMDVTL